MTVVVYDTIVLNIPNALRNLVAGIEVRIDEQQTPGAQTGSPITFTASLLMGSFSGQQLRFTIPQRSIAAIDKSSAYFAKVSDHKKDYTIGRGPSRYGVSQWGQDRQSTFFVQGIIVINYHRVSLFL